MANLRQSQFGKGNRLSSPPGKQNCDYFLSLAALCAVSKCRTVVPQVFPSDQPRTLEQ
jgi:hypothetical protein